MKEKPNSGIYEIRNLVDNNIYIGSSSCLRNRFRQHIESLKYNRHCNYKLQNSFNKYGSGSFKIKILIYCDCNNLLLYEQSIMNKLLPHFNIIKIAGNSLNSRRRTNNYFNIISPDGIVYNKIDNLSRFCRDNNLSRFYMTKLLLGERSNYMGWRRYKSNRGFKIPRF